jgi:uncharacterized protein (DUF1778 family)
MERKDKEPDVLVSDRKRSAVRAAAVDAPAEDLLPADPSMVVPSDVFDRLLAWLEEPPALAPALKKALTGPRFEHR